MMDLDFRTDGAQRFRCALSLADINATLDALSHLPPDRPGQRLTGMPTLDRLFNPSGPVGEIATGLLSDQARPVRAVLFEKSEATNWGLGWHQDRTIVVRARTETPGYGPWSVKSGLIHVAPPFDLLEGMATLRVHLDDVDADNAPLLISPGSHRDGRLLEAEVPATVDRRGVFACFADAGDVWAYSTPILHASNAAVKPRRRRVLQIDYAGRDLDGDLEWLGV